MQLKRLKINHFVGVPSADIEFDRPVSLFVGKNNQGKSTIKDSLEFGFTGKARAMTKFKDVGNLSHGNNGMAVGIDYLDQDGDECSIHRTPSTAGKNVLESSLLHFCLNPHEFIALPARERGKVLAEVLGGGLNDVIKAAIAEQIGNIDNSLLTEIKASGVDVLDVDAFRNEIVEIRRALKRTKKELPDKSPLLGDYELEDGYDVSVDEKGVKKLGDRIAKGGEIIAEARRQLEIKADLMVTEKSIEEFKGEIKKVPSLPPGISADEITMTSVYCNLIESLLKECKAANIKCPLCDGVRKRDSLIYKQKKMEEWLKLYHGRLIDRDEIVKQNAACESELDRLEEKRKQLNEKFKGVDYKEGSENLLKNLTEQRDVLQANIANCRRFKEAEAEYGQAEKNAVKLDALIAECDRIDEALKDGGPVKSAIAAGGCHLPINENLLQLWNMPTLTWSDNGEISLIPEGVSNHVSIEYASASEQYRAGCVMAMALAEVSGVGIAALDGFEILVSDNANAFFQAVNECHIKNVLVFASSDKDYSQVDIPDWLQVFQVIKGKVTRTS
ncbi:MAG TPA: hypothetical protein VMY06_14775 [Sedimentisphaerales bacterium]|nr:hypothetical protein [Sedimentisphaerales bacterium]HUU15594.1 hypothetical protein [Sedimentisphaerales bacterium]